MSRYLSCLLVIFAIPSFAEPPKVIKAIPENGAADVDPDLKEIVIEFDQSMNKGGRSIVGGGESFPEIVGQPRWTSATRIVIPVKLKPGHEYWLSINNTSFQNFRSVKGESAIPYPIAFSTAGGEKIAAEVQKQAIENLRKAIDENYSYRDLRSVDWKEVFAKYQPKLEASETSQAFARVTAELLGAAKDAHISVEVNGSRRGTFQRNITPNVNFRTLPQVIPNWRHENNSIVATGKCEDGITYLLIGSWPGKDLPEEIFEAIASADPKKGLIIDVRTNGGGDEPAAQKVAGCFITEEKIYSKNTTIHDGKWSETYDRVVKPNKARPAYRGKVVVLIGPVCMSSNESFILMMKSAGATLIGGKTYGSSGNPKPHDLGNGVTVFLPSWKDLFPDGSLLEGVGIAPDIVVETTIEELKSEDAVIDEALKELRK